MHAYCWVNEAPWKDGVVPTMWLSEKRQNCEDIYKKKDQRLSGITGRGGKWIGRT